MYCHFFMTERSFMENQKHQYTALYERTNHMSVPYELNGILTQKELLIADGICKISQFFRDKALF